MDDLIMILPNLAFKHGVGGIIIEAVLFLGLWKVKQMIGLYRMTGKIGIFKVGSISEMWFVTGRLTVQKKCTVFAPRQIVTA